MKYTDYIKTRLDKPELDGFRPVWMPSFLFDFQSLITEWSLRIGRGAILADCGLGKTPMQLVWSQNMVRKLNKPGLILAPLTVSRQTIREGAKFGIEVHDARSGKLSRGINICNYEKLHYFDISDFAWIVCDESSILKNFDGKRRKEITRALRKVRYRLLCSAIFVFNDFVELGTSSEALGVMSRNKMLGMFFAHKGEKTQDWTLKGHAQKRFWQWVAGWARAIRKPSDFDFDDSQFVLPKLKVIRDVLPSEHNGRGFFYEARSLKEQRLEKRKSIELRGHRVCETLPENQQAVVWCHLNDEGHFLEKLIPDAQQVAGSDSDEAKEEKLEAFVDGQLRVLITKPKIAGFGMNWQHCSYTTCFPSYSYEQYYQLIRRFWRFGQKNEVTVRIVGTEAESRIIASMIKKEAQVNQIFDQIIQEMKPYQVKNKQKAKEPAKKVEIPSWL